MLNEYCTQFSVCLISKTLVFLGHNFVLFFLTIKIRKGSTRIYATTFSFATSLYPNGDWILNPLDEAWNIQKQLLSCLKLFVIIGICHSRLC